MNNKARVDLVEKVIENQKDMNALSVDKINETKVVEPAPITELTSKQRASNEGVQYIEPLRKLKSFGILPEKLRAEHKRGWEYVKGILENFEVNTEPVRFWFSWYPGDADSLWEVPCNKPVYVPRIIAKHLESVSKYHTFGYVEKASQAWRADDFTHNFAAVGVHYRSKFRPIEAFE